MEFDPVNDPILLQPKGGHPISLLVALSIILNLLILICFFLF